MATHYYSDMVDRKTACYRLYDSADRLLYVGISMVPHYRLPVHRRKPWWRDVATIRIQWFPGRECAKVAEAVAIRDEHPIFNIAQPKPEGMPDALVQD